MDRNYSLRPSENTSWISALDAVHLISPKVGSDKKAKKIIVERLNDSSIEATAWWLAKGYDVGFPHFEKPMILEQVDGKTRVYSADELFDLRVEASKPAISTTRMGTNFALEVSSGNVFIGTAFWRSATPEDQLQWDWASGLFKFSFFNPAITLPRDGSLPKGLLSRMRMYALGVHFLLEDIEKIVGLEKPALPEPPAAPSRVGRKLADTWGNWVAEVVWFYHNEGIKDDLSVNGLVEQIEEIAAKRGIAIPSKNTVRPAAGQILKILDDRLALRHP